MRRTRGYALVLVMTISLILAIGIGTLLTYLASAEKNSARNRLNREAYYVCDGVGRIISRTTVDVLSNSHFSDEDELKAVVEQKLAEDVAAASGAGAGAEDGPPVGLSLLLDELRQEYVVDEFVYTDVAANTAYGQVALGRYRGLNGQRRTFSYVLGLRREGGSTCRTSATIDTVSVPFSELALFSTESLHICPDTWETNDVSRRGRYHVNGNLLVGEYALPRTTVTGTMTPGCGATSLTVCGESGPCVDSLANGAAATVAEVLADGERGTSELKFQTSTVGVPRGAFLDDVTADDPELSNQASMRYLVEPPRSGEDPAQNGRLAHLAHVRILDGAWYVNDGTDWPGKLIWSDHPGAFEVEEATSSEEYEILGSTARRQIGQTDVPDMPTPMPTRYSYFGPAGGTFAEATRPVVSYGHLKRTASNRWDPAFGVGSDDVDKARAAAKLGFIDRHRRLFGAANGGRVAPINIDLKALINAIEADDEDSGELGARLSEADIDPKRLIVWVGSTWTGSRTLPRPAPLPEAPTDVDPVPYPMCDKTSDSADPNNCARAKDRRINAVRVFNGDILPETHRITIATHLPLYVLGDIDRGAPNGSLIHAPGLAITGPILGNNTPSLFFAGDTVTLLSSSWTDPNTNDFAAEGVSLPSVNVATVYNASIMTGRFMSRQPEQKAVFGAERAVRFLERPTAPAHTPIVTGSLLIGYKSVYDVSPTCYEGVTDSDCSTSPQWRHFWSELLMSESAAPPGMPKFALRGVGETVPDSLDPFAFLSLLFPAITFDAVGFD